MHGMYQIEFFNELQKLSSLQKGFTLTSGFMTGVPAGQHIGLLDLHSIDENLSSAMNRFSQSQVWTKTELQSLKAFSNPSFEATAAARFRQAFDRFEGELYQKAVMCDVWTRQRNFISYYPRTFTWLCPISSPHMCADYANFFMSLSEQNLHDRHAVELMFAAHYPDIARIGSNSNGLKSINSVVESSLLFASRAMRRLKASSLLPLRYRNEPIEFDLKAVVNCGKESVYPLLQNDIAAKSLTQSIGGSEVFDVLHSEAEAGDIRSYLKLLTLQAVAVALNFELESL